MKTKLLTLIITFSILTGWNQVNAKDVEGKVKVETPSVISVVDFRGQLWLTNVNKIDSTYNIKLESDTPQIMTLFLTYEDNGGEKRQIYTPILVDGTENPIVIDIDQKYGYPVITSEENNQKAFLDFTDFLVGNLKGGVAEKYTARMAENIRKKTKDLRDVATDTLVNDYLQLWGESTIWLAERLKNRRNRQPDQGFNVDSLINITTDELIENKATKYFPEFVALVSNERAPGKTLSEKVENLHNNLPQGDLRDYIETRLIVQFINQNKGQTPEEEIITQIDAVGKDREEYDSWIDAVKSYKSYLQRGDEAPDDILYSEDGKEFRISDFKGKYLFIDFWASWCVYCVKELPALEQIKKEFADSNIEFIGISLDENPKNWKAALEKYGLAENQFIVSSPDFAEKLGLSAIPRYMIYDPEGKMLYPEAPRPRQYEKLSELLKSLG